MAMRAFVTGAGGFIGSHLVQALLDAGWQVRALARYNSRSSWGWLEQVGPPAQPALEVVLGDVTDPFQMARLTEGVDVVFHLAALIGIPYSYVAPESYVATNVVGTLNLLEAVRRNRVPRMVHTSTSETYGTARYEPIDELHPLQGQSPYSASKIGADKLTESYYLSFDVPVITARPFNTYGPRQSARAVIPTVISQLLSGKEMVELGSLEPVRDLTYVEDTARGFLELAGCDQAVGEVVNLGSGNAVSVGALAEMLVKMVNPSAKIVSRDERVRPAKSEVMKLVCNNAKVRQLTGWRPRVSLEDGLKRTVEFIRGHLQLYRVDQYTI